MRATEKLVWGTLIHWIVDWMMQNEWQATNKTDLRHPAAYVHSGLHTIAQRLVYSWPVAIAIGLTHLLIDTRVPLQWWRRRIRQTTDPANPVSIHVAIWGDQVAHLAVLGGAALVETHCRAVRSAIPAAAAAARAAWSQDSTASG